MFGRLVKDKKLIGYRMPEYEVHKRQAEERRVKAEITNSQMKQAERALEWWALWLSEATNGYGDSSSNLDDSDRLPACSRPPYGVEMSEEVAKVIRVFERMKSIDETHKGYVFVIKSVLSNRKENETIKSVLKRIKNSPGQDRFLQARKRFAQLFIILS